MLLRHFRLEQTWTMEDAERITEKHPNETAWPIAGPLWLARNGFIVTVIFDFDYLAMVEEGNAYIRRRYGDEVADWQAEHGSKFVNDETAHAFLNEVDVRQRVPTLDDIALVLEIGGLAVCGVNSKRLKGEEGYIGHNIVVWGVDDHDGVPPADRTHF